MNWKYKTIKLAGEGFWITEGRINEVAFEEEMNRLGSQGWELVSVFDTNRGGGGTNGVITVFKRTLG